MRAAIGLVIACVLAAPAVASAEKKDKPKKGGPPAQSGEESAASPRGGGATGSITVAFTTSQREAAHGWYAESYGRGNCPPGLAKKNNGCLPPGQAKKRYTVGHPLPADVRWSSPPPSLVTRLGPPPAGYLYVSLDGDLLKLAVGTMLVVDAIQGLVN